MLSCLTVSFSCVVYSSGNTTPESEKKAAVGISHQTENEKENFVYVPGTYRSPFVVALAAGMNSNPPSREKNSLEKYPIIDGEKALRQQKNAIHTTAF